MGVFNKFKYAFGLGIATRQSCALQLKFSADVSRNGLRIGPGGRLRHIPPGSGPLRENPDMRDPLPGSTDSPAKSPGEQIPTEVVWSEQEKAEE